jgi:hypothetical protein
MRPETGYAGGHDPHATELTLAHSGIWRVDLQTATFGEAMVTLAIGTDEPFRTSEATPATD